MVRGTFLVSTYSIVKMDKGIVGKDMVVINRLTHEGDSIGCSGVYRCEPLKKGFLTFIRFKGVRLFLTME